MTKTWTAILFILSSSACDAQKGNPTDVPQSSGCNRAVYGTVKYIESLPAYICIPDGFIIDDFVRTSDINRDGKDDFLALKFNKKQDDQVDGDTTYWRFYTRKKGDSIFTITKTLTNLVPPFVSDVSGDYLLTHPIAMKIVNDFPFRLKSHALSFRVNSDTIRLSYKIEDTYGKTFVFVFYKDNWFLENVEYFIGELPMYWWRESEFYYPLNDKLKVIETRKPTRRISIEEFDLTKGFKYQEDEWMHLSEWHIDRIDKSKWRSIEDVKFDKCDGIDLPEDWSY